MSYRIPNNGIYNQPSKGDSQGNLYTSHNLDLRKNPSKLGVSSRLTVLVKDNDSGISNMGVPIAVAIAQKTNVKQYYVACGIGQGIGTAGTGKILVSDSATITDDYDNEGTASTPTTIHLDYSDMVGWRSFLYVSTFTLVASSKLQQLTSSWDTDFLNTRSGAYKTQGGLKNLCPAFNGNLYFTDDDEVNYIPPSGNAVQSGTGIVDCLGVYRPIWIRSSSNRLWIGLMTKDSGIGSRGFVAEWDTTGTAFNKVYDIEAPCALSCAIKNDVPWIVDAYGRLKRFNGGAFVEVARLPVANMNIEMPGIYDDTTNARWIHHRGMDVVDGRININVNNFVSTGVYIEEMPSGVWELNEDNPIFPFLYHKASPCTTSAASVIDWGQKQISTAGCLFGSKRSTATYLAGYGYYTDNATTERKGLFYDDIATNANKRGIFTLPFISSSEVGDTWQKLSYRFRPLQSGDSIIAKQRTAKHATLPLLIGITWTSTTTFTTSTNILAYDAATLGFKPEIEIVMGTSSGTTAQITGVVDSGGGVYTATLDDAIGAISGSGKAYITNFRKITSITDTGIHESTQPIGVSDTKVQIKTELRVTGDFELDDITIINSSHKKAQ